MIVEGTHPKVSIIVPVYNVALYLHDCLESILNQTLEEIEVICINDGSTDDSLSILEDYANIDKRMIIISQENAGLGAARNVGVKAARSKYLLFVDSDDWIALDACEKLYDIAELQQLDMLQASYHLARHKTDDSLLESSVERNIFVDQGVKVCEKNYCLSPFNWDKLWNRAFFIDQGLFNIEGILYEDVLTSCKGFLKASKVAVVDMPFYFYRQREGSIFNQKAGIRHINSLKIVCEQLFLMIEQEQLWGNAGFVKAFSRVLERLCADADKQVLGVETFFEIREFVALLVSKVRKHKPLSLPFDFIVYQVLYLPINLWKYLHNAYFSIKGLLLNFKK